MASGLFTKLKLKSGVVHSYLERYGYRKSGRCIYVKVLAYLYMRTSQSRKLAERMAQVLQRTIYQNPPLLRFQECSNQTLEVTLVFLYHAQDNTTDQNEEPQW